MVLTFKRPTQTLRNEYLTLLFQIFDWFRKVNLSAFLIITKPVLSDSVLEILFMLWSYSGRTSFFSCKCHLQPVYKRMLSVRAVHCGGACGLDAIVNAEVKVMSGQNTSTMSVGGCLLMTSKHLTRLHWMKLAYFE